jgi:AcrR family transcriptional regulator
VSAEARVAARRARLLAAGLQLFGTQGYLHTTIDQVCAEAGLTKRYFYESFRSCEDLLGVLVRSLWVEAAQRGMTAVATAPAGLDAQIRRGIGAVVDYYTGDPRRGRVAFVAAVGISDRIEVQRREYVGVFTALLQSYAAEPLGELIPPERTMRLNAGALVGAAANW